MTTKRARTTAHAPSQSTNPQTTNQRSSSRHAPTDALETYRAKRHFDVTPEPSPGSSPAGAKKEKKSAAAAPHRDKEFVVQKHDATRLHYDVRLEIAGAMMSWAVPKGPSYDPSVKRLAVETEDHPMEYNRFEGRIPDGEYGAGDVLIWDRGTYDTVPPGQEEAMRAKGHLHVRLCGEKLEGEWHLVRTGGKAKGDSAGGPKTPWLLFKAKDALASAQRDIVAERPDSVVSGKSATRGPRRVGASKVGKTPAGLLAAVGGVALAVGQSQIAGAQGYLFEIKYDGYRLVACKAGPAVRLYTRRHNDWTSRFPTVEEALAQLPALEAVIDGEVCAVDANGRPSFGALQRWLAGDKGKATLAYAAFDLLWLDGRDLRAEPLEARRELLEALLSKASAPVSFSQAIDGELPQILNAVKASGLEGLMAKKKGSKYAAGRTAAWVKLKFTRRQDCAILGYLPIKGSAKEVGALLLGVVDKGNLRFAGRVGSGFDTKTRKDLARRINAIALDRAPIAPVPAAGLRDAVWCTPELVCEISFSEWSQDGAARTPTYVGLRDDKAPGECTLDADPVADVAAMAAKAPAASPRAPSAKRTQSTPSSSPSLAPTLTNPDKVLFPRDGITKREIYDYYTAIAPVMLPHLEGRPLALQRWPHGIDGEAWFQQGAPPKTPDYVRLLAIGNHHKKSHRIVAENVETLQYLANLAALTLHQWASHAPKEAKTDAQILKELAKPDYFVIDLDPGDGTWADLIEVARAVRKLIDALEFESVVKTSGKRGLHIVVPIQKGPSHAEATAFAENMARAVAKVLPQIATVERMKAKRGGKLYVDFGQNGEGKTIVAPYTVRAKDGATVSTPILWSEVTEKLDPTRFTIRTVLARVEKHGDLFANALARVNRLPALVGERGR